MLPRTLPELQEAFQDRLHDFVAGAIYNAGEWEVRCFWVTQDDGGTDIKKTATERHEKFELAVENCYRTVQRT